MAYSQIPRVLLLIGTLVFCASAGAVLTPEQATEVGGGLTHFSKRIRAERESAEKVLAAAPETKRQLVSTFEKISSLRSPDERAANLWTGLVGGLLIGALVFVYRRSTARMRRRFEEDALKARGAAGFLALDAGSWLVLATGAYALVEVGYTSRGEQELLGIALFWAFVRWRLFMVLLEAVLRPSRPTFRLISMSDAAALQVKVIAGAAILVGIAGISVMPVLLRAGLAVPNGQFIVLLQGIVVAGGCALALWRFRASHSTPPLQARIWIWLGGILIGLLWFAWSADVLLLDFGVYHALEWSVRIAGLTYVVDAILGLSGDRSWVRFAQRSITAAAVLAIGILLAEVWLVTELALVSDSTWASVRRSLISASTTLYVGYIAWRYLHHWTEERLKAAVPGLPGSSDDDEVGAKPASRLTTVLPILRVLAGVAILVIAVLLALLHLGVEIAPLLAGAGVIGLAISFGSQALVRDIVSGIFFMADDAFRVGEYIDTGRLKGTVERISLRSVRLRHQNGQIHTIPYGQLTSITNFSRDWQTVKFTVRLARDTDVEKVRKAVKQIGQDMTKDPELGKELLQPLKLQGVSEIADSALVVRLKFTVRPLKPSWVQREALKRLYRDLPEKGIEFASNAITVQTSGSGARPTEVAGAAAAGTGAGQPPIQAG